MDRESKVEHGRPFGQLDQFACRGEDIDLVFVQVHLEILHQVERVVLFRFQGGTDSVQEFVQPAFRLSSFIFPVSGQSPFGNFVHAAGTDLHFHPFVLWSHHGDMQTFVTVRFRDRYPVLHAFRVRLVHIGDDRVDLPAVRTLLLIRRVEDDADGKQVVYVFERDVLFLQLVVDGVDGLRASLDVELQPSLLQLAFDRGDELGDVGVARTFRLV